MSGGSVVPRASEASLSDDEFACKLLLGKAFFDFIQGGVL